MSSPSMEEAVNYWMQPAASSDRDTSWFRAQVFGFITAYERAARTQSHR